MSKITSPLLYRQFFFFIQEEGNHVLKTPDSRREYFDLCAAVIDGDYLLSVPWDAKNDITGPYLYVREEGGWRTSLKTLPPQIQAYLAILNI